MVRHTTLYTYGPSILYENGHIRSTGFYSSTIGEGDGEATEMTWMCEGLAPVCIKPAWSRGHAGVVDERIYSADFAYEPRA
jgi:hypothetical protein